MRKNASKHIQKSNQPIKNECVYIYIKIIHPPFDCSYLSCQMKKMFFTEPGQLLPSVFTFYASAEYSFTFTVEKWYPHSHLLLRKNSYKCISLNVKCQWQLIPVHIFFDGKDSPAKTREHSHHWRIPSCMKGANVNWTVVSRPYSLQLLHPDFEII